MANDIHKLRDDIVKAMEKWLDATTLRDVSNAHVDAYQDDFQRWLLDEGVTDTEAERTNFAAYRVCLHMEAIFNVHTGRLPQPTR